MGLCAFLDEADPFQEFAGSAVIDGSSGPDTEAIELSECVLTKGAKDSGAEGARINRRARQFYSSFVRMPIVEDNPGD